MRCKHCIQFAKGRHYIQYLDCVQHIRYFWCPGNPANCQGVQCTLYTSCTAHTMCTGYTAYIECVHHIHCTSSDRRFIRQTTPAQSSCQNSLTKNLQTSGFFPSKSWKCIKARENSSSIIQSTHTRFKILANSLQVDLGRNL